MRVRMQLRLQQRRHKTKASRGLHHQLEQSQEYSRRRFCLWGGIALASVVCGLTGCVNQHPEGKEASGNRLVATSVALLEICDRLDMDLIGVPRTTREIPARYAQLPEIGPPMSPDLEVLSTMHPTCIISPNSLIEDLRVKYAAIGLPCIFADLRSVPGMYDSIDYLGAKFNRQDQAIALRSEYLQLTAQFAGRVKDLVAPRVLLLMGVPGSYLVATENSYAGSLIKMAGGINVYEGETDEFLNANTEDMQSRDPDIILRTAHALPDSVMAMFAEEFETNDIWKHFRAVQQGRVYDLPYELFGMSASFEYPQALDYLYEVLYKQVAA